MSTKRAVVSMKFVRHRSHRVAVVLCATVSLAGNTQSKGGSWMAYREEAGGFGRDTCHVGLVEDLSQLDAFRAADCLHAADVHVEALWRRVAAPNLVVLNRDGPVPVGGEHLPRCSLNQTGKTAYTGAHAACTHLVGRDERELC